MHVHVPQLAQLPTSDHYCAPHEKPRYTPRSTYLAAYAYASCRMHGNAVQTWPYDTMHAPAGGDDVRTYAPYMRNYCYRGGSEFPSCVHKLLVTNVRIEFQSRVKGINN